MTHGQIQGVDSADADEKAIDPPHRLTLKKGLPGPAGHAGQGKFQMEQTALKFDAALVAEFREGAQPILTMRAEKLIAALLFPLTIRFGGARCLRMAQLDLQANELGSFPVAGFASLLEPVGDDETGRGLFPMLLRSVKKGTEFHRVIQDDPVPPG